MMFTNNLSHFAGACMYVFMCLKFCTTMLAGLIDSSCFVIPMSVTQLSFDQLAVPLIHGKKH